MAEMWLWNVKCRNFANTERKLKSTSEGAKWIDEWERDRRGSTGKLILGFI